MNIQKSLRVFFDDVIYTDDLYLWSNEKLNLKNQTWCKRDWHFKLFGCKMFSKKFVKQKRSPSDSAGAKHLSIFLVPTFPLESLEVKNSLFLLYFILFLKYNLSDFAQFRNRSFEFIFEISRLKMVFYVQVERIFSYLIW